MPPQKTRPLGRRFLKWFLITVGVLVVIALAWVAIFMFNMNRFAMQGPDPRDRDAAISNYGGKPVDGDYLRGIHFAPIGEARPGTVIVFGGSEGSSNPALAAQLADAGHNVLSLYYFGQPGQQEALSEIPLEFFDETLAWAERNSAEGPITVMGASKGAELAANLAVRYAEIDHIVAYAPSGFTYAGLRFDSPEQYSSFTWQGEPLPFASFSLTPTMIGRLTLGLPVSYLDTYEQAAADAPAEARIPIENFSGSGLLFAGGDDQMWQSATAAQNLAEANPSLDAVIYPEAGHLFAEDITELGPSWEVMMGGTVEANREAKLDSDALLLERLEQWHG